MDGWSKATSYRNAANGTGVAQQQQQQQVSKRGGRGGSSGATAATVSSSTTTTTTTITARRVGNDESAAANSGSAATNGSNSNSSKINDSSWRDSTGAKRQPNKILVSAQAIARVIGRGGQNINAIREASGAHIEVEKQQKGQTDRLITIRYLFKIILII